MLSGAVVLGAAAGACAAAAVVEIVGDPRARRRRNRRDREPSARLAGVTALLVRLGRRAGAPVAHRELEARIAAAGAPLNLTPPDVMALKGATALAGLLAGLPLFASLPGRLGFATLLCAPAAGFLVPDVVLSRRARRRAERIAQELADVLDLLRVAVEAGLPVGRALAEVGRRAGGDFARELAAAAARMELGSTRAEAFDALVARCPVPAVAGLAAAVSRAERHGAPLAMALEALAVEARADQARRLRDEAARAAPKIQLVVALVLVPAVMLLVGAVLMQSLAPGS